MPEYSIEYPHGPQGEEPNGGKTYSLIEDTVTRTSPKMKEGPFADANDNEELNAGSRALALTILNRVEIEGVPRLRKITIGTKELLGEEKRVRTAEIEKLEGETLNKLENIDLSKKKEIITQIARIAAECAQAGILHNDISPRNALYNIKEDKTYLIDFDGALLMDKYGTEEEGFARIRAGGIPYTFAYSSPEKTNFFERDEVLQDTIGETSDVYSIACVGLAVLIGTSQYETKVRIHWRNHREILEELLRDSELDKDPFCTYLLEQIREDPQDRSAKTLKQLYEKLKTLANEA